jgi:hypothetical protein
MREKLNMPEWCLTLVTSVAVAALLIIFGGCASVDPMTQPASRERPARAAQLCEVRTGSYICKDISRQEIQDVLDVLSPR